MVSRGFLWGQGIYLLQFSQVVFCGSGVFEMVEQTRYVGSATPGSTDS